MSDAKDEWKLSEKKTRFLVVGGDFLCWDKKWVRTSILTTFSGSFRSSIVWLRASA